MGLLSKAKGKVCHSFEELTRAWAAFVAKGVYHDEIAAHDPGAVLPMLQEYLGNTAHDSFSIGGFVDPSRKIIIGLASRKIFQRPRRLGVGVAFEAEPMRQDFLAAVLKLCTRVGYSGVFEAEYLLSNQPGQYLLADFNPRFYGQMGFEIARGLPLPLFVYHLATGDEEGFQRTLTHAAANLWQGDARYANSLTLRLMLKTQLIGGLLTMREYRRWRSWLSATEVKIYDALKDSEDMALWMADRRAIAAHAMRHPRDFFRKFFRDS